MNKDTETVLRLKTNDSYKDNLLLHYKPLIIPQKYKIKDIEDFLIDRYEATKIDFMQLSDGFRNHVLCNINNIIHDRKPNISMSDILVYILPENESTKDYYLHSYTPISINQNAPKSIRGKIGIILEPNTEYIESGSAKLFLEATLKLGISQYDYDNNTDELLCYISRYKMYYDKRYQKMI